MAKNYDCEKILGYCEDAAWSALESMMLRKADLRTPADGDMMKTCLKIINMTNEDMPAASAAMQGSYADGMARTGYIDPGISTARGRGRHYVRAHYSYADDPRYPDTSTGNTIAQMMDMASPQEKKVLERLLREVDD